MSKLFKTMGGILLTLALLLSMSVSAFAYTRVDTGAETSLTLEYHNGSTALAGASFRIYKVAEISETNQYTLTGAFADYSVSLEDMDSSEKWANLATTLAAYAARDAIAPTAEGVTDASGKLTFSGLTVGLYLVVGDPLTVDSVIYTPTPFLISLPNLADDQWVNDVTAEIKFEIEEIQETTDRTVVKIWEDGKGFYRPDSVTVQLLCNGKVYSEVKLSEKNNWRYTWTGLSADDTWQITEKYVPDDYSVSISRSGKAFIITNTYVPDIYDYPDTPDQPDEPEQPETNEEPTLPQTGQLWWPIPLLAGCGLALFAVGWWLVFLKRKKDA